MMSPPAATSGRNATTARLADVFAVQDEITEAIVAAIEPQLYAAENFRAAAQAAGQHGRLGSGDAGALALLAGDAAGQCGGAGLAGEGDRIDPNYGQALGVLATSQTFSAHMGWADMAAAAPIAERAALAAIRADSEDPWAHHALGSAYLFARRFEDLAGRV